WDQTLGAISGRDPLAVRLLEAMAWMAPDDVPRGLLEPLARDAVALNRGLGVLHSYNMVGFIGQRFVSVHRLVQQVLRRRSDGRVDAEQILQQAVSTLEEVESSASEWQQVLPHIEALAENAPGDSVPTSDMAEAYEAAAQYLFRQQRDGQTIVLRQQVLLYWEQARGDADHDTLVARGNLALAYVEADAPDKAIPLLQSTLAQREEASGDTGPEILTIRNNLALAYINTGDLDQAIPLMKTTLAERERLLGTTHAHTLTSRHNLACAFAEAGDLDQAIPLMETTLAQCEEIRGVTHPYTLTTRFVLATAYAETGDLDRAISLLETTLVQREQVLGDTHPYTQLTRDTLASLRQEPSN
ncbi:MAG: tetratricopeptide repeat protein, partial [Streptomyces sp.]|nr:tetratricopeptide repeat protein [Streptomyces sp.]